MGRTVFGFDTPEKSQAIAGMDRCVGHSGPAVARTAAQHAATQGRIMCRRYVTMIVRLARTLDPFTFAEKYPRAHLVLGYFDPRFAIDEEASGAPTLLTVLMTAQNTLGLVGECTGAVDTSNSTMRLSYALAEDAARVCGLVNAELLGIRNRRLAEITVAYQLGEPVEHLYGRREPPPKVANDDAPLSPPQVFDHR
jgi:hypothetical protein